VRRVTPPDRTVWVRVPPGRADSASARLAVLPPEHRVTFVEHAVARGETLGQIAARYHVTVDLILSANRGVKARSLRPGRVLVIPTSGVAPSRWSYASRGTRPALRRTPAVMLSSVARSGAKPPAAAASRTVHIVRRGENAGKTLPHKNIVRELARLGGWSGEAEHFALPAGDPALSTAILVQTSGAGPILAAAKE
jgi:LysM repeat protein